MRNWRMSKDGATIMAVSCHSYLGLAEILLYRLEVVCRQSVQLF